MCLHPELRRSPLGTVEDPVNFTSPTSPELTESEESNEDSLPEVYEVNGVDSSSAECIEEEEHSPQYSPSSPERLSPAAMCWHTERCNGDGELVSVLDDRDESGFYECLVCTLSWNSRYHSITHFMGNHHARRVSFLRGEPMVYCAICNVLP